MYPLHAWSQAECWAARKGSSPCSLSQAESSGPSLGWLAGRVHMTDRAREEQEGLFPHPPLLHLAASLCFLQRISCSPLCSARLLCETRGAGHRMSREAGIALRRVGEAQTLSCQPPGSSAAGRVTDSLTPPWDAASPGGARQCPAQARASCAHRAACVCRQGAGAARSAGTPRSPPPRPAAAPAQAISPARWPAGQW